MNSNQGMPSDLIKSYHSTFGTNKARRVQKLQSWKLSRFVIKCRNFSGFSKSTILTQMHCLESFWTCTWNNHCIVSNDQNQIEAILSIYLRVGGIFVWSWARVGPISSKWRCRALRFPRDVDSRFWSRWSRTRPLLGRPVAQTREHSHEEHYEILFVSPLARFPGALIDLTSSKKCLNSRYTTLVSKKK